MNTRLEPDDTLIEGLARVVAVDGTQVWLTAEQPAACGSCATRSAACGSGSAKPAASWRAPRSLGLGQAPLAMGERVRIGVNRRALTRATLTAYALPLVTMLTAVVVMQGASDGVTIVAALLGLLAGVLVARVLSRRWRNALVPLVLGRALNAAGSSCTPHDTGGLRPIAIPVVEQRSL